MSATSSTLRRSRIGCELTSATLMMRPGSPLELGASVRSVTQLLRVRRSFVTPRASEPMVPREQLGCPMASAGASLPVVPGRSRQLGAPKLLLRSPPRLPGARRFGAWLHAPSGVASAS
jgi:hypothetical protein